MLLSRVRVMAILIDVSVTRDFGLELVVIFIASIRCLIASQVAFLRDIFMSLRAPRLEVDRARAPR